MYQKVIIPLDGSKEAEGVLPLVQREIGPDTQIVLLQVIQPVKDRSLMESALGSQLEETEKTRALVYLRDVLRRFEGDPLKWRCEAIVAESVADGIAEFARLEGADLIAMYSPERKGLAGLIKKSVAKDVQKKASMEVKTYSSEEVARVT